MRHRRSGRSPLPWRAPGQSAAAWAFIFDPSTVLDPRPPPCWPPTTSVSHGRPFIHAMSSVTASMTRLRTRSSKSRLGSRQHDEHRDLRPGLWNGAGHELASISTGSRVTSRARTCWPEPTICSLGSRSRRLWAGAEALWLAARGWRVTAVDFSVTALDHARSTAQTIGADVAERIEWTEGDLATWTPSPGHYDLVISLYVHVNGSVEAMIRGGAGVAPGGTLLLVGHRPVDPATGAPTPAADKCRSQSTPPSTPSTCAPGGSSLPSSDHGPQSAPCGARSCVRSRAPSLAGAAGMGQMLRASSV